MFFTAVPDLPEDVPQSSPFQGSSEVEERVTGAITFPEQCSVLSEVNEAEHSRLREPKLSTCSSLQSYQITRVHHLESTPALNQSRPFHEPSNLTSSQSSHYGPKQICTEYTQVTVISERFERDEQLLQKQFSEMEDLKIALNEANSRLEKLSVDVTFLKSKEEELLMENKRLNKTLNVKEKKISSLSNQLGIKCRQLKAALQQHQMTRERQSITNRRRQLKILKAQQKDKHSKLLKKEYLQKCAELKIKLNKMSKNLKAAKNPNQTKFHNKVKNVLASVLTPNQLDIIFKKKNRAKWTPEEYSTALTIRYLSRRCYLFLKNKLNYPLPGLSTLRRWASKINLRHGILWDVLNVMKISGETKSAFDKIAVLTFDEMKVARFYEYSKIDDEIIGPHNYAQVVMVRGLFDNWKQPVFLDFDLKMTKDLLLKTITELHNIGYSIVAVASDCGGGNQGVWKEFSISSDKPYFLHPVTQEKVYLFADAPHLLKLLRNWFLDTGFKIDGKDICKSPLETMIKKNETEVSSMFKLSELHVKCSKTKRQNVRLAAELFSRSVGTALKQYLPGDDKELARLVGEFITLVNRWFDLFNSYSLTAKVPSKKPFGVLLESQLQTLDEMVRTVQNMLCIGKTCLQVFQKMIILSANSLKGLYEDLKKKFQTVFILTHRLNQDLLENLFSQLRNDGGLNDHPSPMTLIYRLRRLLLCKNPGMIQESANVIIPEEVQCDFLVRETFHQARLTLPEDTIGERPEEELIISEDIESLNGSATTVSISENMTFVERDGLIYLAGAVARKHKVLFPYLGKYTKDLEVPFQEHSYCLPSWISHLSFGGLIEPSDQWYSEVLSMEKYFRKLHNETFKFKKNITEKTTAYVTSKIRNKNIDIDPVLIKAFCSTRIFIRIRFLNFRRVQILLRKKEEKAALAEKERKEKELKEKELKEKTDLSSTTQQNSEKGNEAKTASDKSSEKKVVDRKGRKRKSTVDRKTAKKMRRIVK